MRHVGVLFQARKGGVVHISQGGWRPPHHPLHLLRLCEEDFMHDVPYSSAARYGRTLSALDRFPHKPALCKRCQKSAESIARAIGWVPK